MKSVALLLDQDEEDDENTDVFLVTCLSLEIEKRFPCQKSKILFLE